VRRQPGADRKNVVEHAGDHHSAAGLQGAITGARDRRGAHHRLQRDFVGPGDLEEICCGGTGAQCRHGDSGGAKLVGERLAKAQHIGLRSEVDRHPRTRLEAGGRSDQQHPAAAAGDHARQQQPGELGQCHHIDLQHLADPAGIDLVEPADSAEPGIVDQHVHAQPARFDYAGQLRSSTGLAEIRG